MFDKLLNEGMAGDNLGLRLRAEASEAGIAAEDVTEAGTGAGVRAGSAEARNPELAEQLDAAERNIGEVPEGKTVAADASGNRTLSGWTDTEGFLPSSDLVEQVMAKAEEIGFEFKRSGASDWGSPGRFNASHAEPQLSLVSDRFAVSKNMCPSCRSFMNARSVAEGKTFVVKDPTRIWKFPMPE